MALEIGCYYFPNYHTGDARNEAHHGRNWSEWELVKHATPRYLGHQLPRRPLWGYEDEKQPAVMARKIDAAANAGIGYFIFDWYYYDDGPFLARALEDGFLNAPNRHRLKFCTMWANHNWTDIHPATRFSPRTVLYPGKVSRATFERIAQIHVENYFTRPEYYCVDHRPYFSIYDLGQLLSSFGSVTEARRALDDFRTAARLAGFAGVHLNAVAWGNPLLPGEDVPARVPELLAQLGVDSATSYVWVHHMHFTQGRTSYQTMFESYMEHWKKARHEYPCEYFPNITVGWDSSPRLAPSEIWDWQQGAYPCGPLVDDGSPDKFAHALHEVKSQLLALPQKHKIMNINSWNEWTESSYLEPD